MPQHTNKVKADNKRVGLPKPPKVGVRKVGKGIGVLEIPVHVSSGPTRLPEKESEYIHKAREMTAPATRMQEYACRAFKAGTSLSEIAISSGLPFGTLVKTLKTVGLSEEEHKKEIAELVKWFENRRNP